MSFWRRLREAWAGKKPLPVWLAAAHSQAAHQRRGLATLEAAEAWWGDRVDRLRADLDSWERRLRLADSPELRGQVRAIVNLLRGDIKRAESGLEDITRAVGIAEDRMSTTHARLLAETKAHEALGYDVSELVPPDIARMRAEAEADYLRQIPPEYPSEQRQFLDALFRGAEDRNRTLN